MMSEAEEIEKEVLDYNIIVVSIIGVVICIFIPLPFFDYLKVFAVLILFFGLIGLVSGVILPNPILITVLNSFNFGWFYYWFFFEGQQLLAVTVPVVTMIVCFIIGGAFYRKKIVEKYLRERTEILKR